MCDLGIVATGDGCVLGSEVGVWSPGERASYAGLFTIASLAAFSAKKIEIISFILELGAGDGRGRGFKSEVQLQKKA